MNLREAAVSVFWIAVVVVLFCYAITGCGNVSALPDVVGVAGAGGAGESSPDAAGAGDVGGVGGSPRGRDASFDLQDRRDASPVDVAPPAADAGACLDADVAGFALNATCEGGRPASDGCHAACTLNGAPFVGCVEGSPWASSCYASCAACP